MSNRDQTIGSLEQEIRDYINHPRRRAILLSDLASWNMLCSALDVVGDTELALEAYLHWTKLDGAGEKYLLVYGALQVMEVQQDAMKFLCESLSITYARSKELREIRRIRSESIGHPMDGEENKVAKASFIQRFDLDQQAFTLRTVYSDSRPHRRQTIDVAQLLTMQRRLLEETLTKVVEKLRADEMAHREKHKADLLRDLFPDTLAYHVSKISEGPPMAGPSIAMIKQVVAQFRDALKARGDWEECGSAAYGCR